MIDQKLAIMPQREKRRKKKGARTINPSIKSIIVCMRVFYNKSFNETERKIEVKSSTLKTICQQVYKTGDSEDFHEILACIQHKKCFNGLLK